MRKKLVVLTGAGMSAESGIPTFRGGDGLWENHRIEDVASPEGWEKNPQLVLEFYNQRRRKILASAPNRGHEILKSLEAHFEVIIITQNIDNLHERAGSSNVLHLHGLITQARSTVQPEDIYNIEGTELLWGDRCDAGYQLRPNIVWFGEEVPMIPIAAELCSLADYFVVVGTSLQVYPAAGLIHFAPSGIKKFIIDPGADSLARSNDLVPIAKKASEGLEELKLNLLSELQ